MKVTLISYTQHPEEIVAMAARLCYSKKEIGEINDEIDPENIKKFVEKLINMGHLSPLEHTVFTFGIEGISRIAANQLVRHRIASYSQRSQRYVMEEDPEFITPAGVAIQDRKLITNYERAMRDNIDEYTRAVTQISNAIILDEVYLSDDFKISHAEYNEYIRGRDGFKEFKRDYPKKGAEIEKRAIEDARYLLPGGVATKIIVTMNSRSLLNFFNLRTCSRAQHEIRIIAREMMAKCKEKAPVIFKNAGPNCINGNCTEAGLSCKGGGK